MPESCHGIHIDCVDRGVSFYEHRKPLQFASRRFEITFHIRGRIKGLLLGCPKVPVLTAQSTADSTCIKACDLIQRSAGVPRVDFFAWVCAPSGTSGLTLN